MILNTLKKAQRLGYKRLRDSGQQNKRKKIQKYIYYLPMSMDVLKKEQYQ